MASAVFTSGLTYTPGGGGSLTQGFRTTFNYTAVSSGKFDVGIGSTTAVDCPYGGVAVPLGLIIQNNTDVDVGVKIGGGATLYRLAPGGMIMHWQPAPAGAAPHLPQITFTPQGTGPTKIGSIDYIILGN